MEAVNKLLARLQQRQDVALAIVMLMAIFMMILPLPTLLVDLLIAINLALSILLLMMSVYLREPMEFSAFPSVLLITTLYRLALTISTSRLILLQHDAGEIVQTFGDFAIGGNLAVGLIVFAIITVVQFIVITKGSERVAEVGARFSLDAMPGKQMSIDGDLRNGAIDANEARRLRSMVQKESQMYGAMDGAMKFVKGDAIAGIIVILVNIFGGIAIGVFMHGMSAGEAATTYAILSVGDGLIAQIPALLISIAAGIIVTRVPGETRRNLAAELTSQVTRHLGALWLVAAVLTLFACLPGFPTLIFLALAGMVAGSAYWLQCRQREAAPTDKAADASTPPGQGDGEVAIGAVPLLLRVAPDLARGDKLKTMLRELRQARFDETGLPLPEVVLQTDPSMAAGQLDFLLFQESVLALTLRPLLMIDPLAAPVPQAVAQDPLPFGGLSVQWAPAALAPLLEGLGVRFYDGAEQVRRLLTLVLARHSAELIGVQEARFLMDKMEQRYAELVKELQRHLPVVRVADVLRRLLAEGVAIRDLRAVFQALVEWAPVEKDPVMLAEYARLALGRHILGRFRHGQPWLSAWLIGGEIEERLRESIRQTSAGSYSALAPEENAHIVASIRAALAKNHPAGAVLVTAIDVRRFVRKLIEREWFDLPVLSFQEVGDEHEMRVLGHIDWQEDGSDALA
ncbi:MAG: EscV/YscV/HrcV family type III secretion system export apparatus protein [Paludibacterium sp.]|uniref:EscV/YscV/HrcV family type III secretion system export apparatus protein n=1 Tax=Paludibacterium sp. TaxID=1917523 RepID=UPI0025DE50FA|nr:EscV/YscV/HrcV family type III secretion system export apparatus protein [Paludibacterium sp.]MBV8048519.1 EscV/YscV/HrcV family type III secretion system export apparatus protein [Paludibacterium sp.]MBV8646352.1 EscV/YscV/HrcV family type III secretion system export apparatus protein [Paludibacterium sp.]